MNFSFNLSLLTHHSLFETIYQTTFDKENSETIGDINYRINHLVLTLISSLRGAEAFLKTTLNGIMVLLPLTDKTIYLENLSQGFSTPFNSLEHSLNIPFDHFLRALNPATFRPCSLYQVPFESFSARSPEWIPTCKKTIDLKNSPSFFDRELKTRFHLTIFLFVKTAAMIADLVIAVFAGIATVATFGCYEPLDELCNQELKAVTSYALFFSTLSYIISPKRLALIGHKEKNLEFALPGSDKPIVTVNV